MAAANKETSEDRNPRRNSIGLPGYQSRDASAVGKARRYSFGTPSATGEEGNIVPNYLRASTGSCHDFCKYGAKHAQSESKSPIIIPKRVTKNVVSFERKKSTMTDPKPSPEPVEVIKREISSPSRKPDVSKQNSLKNKKAIENEIKTVQHSASNMRPKPSSSAPDVSAGSKKKDIRPVKKIIPKATVVKKVVAKASLTGSSSPKPTGDRVESSKVRKYKNLKPVSPLKDQNRAQKTENLKPVSPLKDQNRTQKTEIEQPITDKVQKNTFYVNHESIESESVSVELTNLQDSDRSQSFSDKEVFEEDPSIIKSSQSFSDKEDSSITPHVFESSQSYSDKEVVEEVEYTDETSSGEEVLEEESEYTENDDEMGTSGYDKIPRNGRMVVSEGKDDEAVKLKFRRGKVLDLQSENTGPTRLKFRRRRAKEVTEDPQSAARTFKTKAIDAQSENDAQSAARKTFKKKDPREETADSNHGSVSVVLKHQDTQGKKDSQGLYNNVIEETASKLVETRKSKVKALVGAFETVISLQDGKPSSTS